jgi:putative transposase
LQTGLEVELTEHLGYEPHSVEGRGSGNSRNGSYPKTVTTDIGTVDLRVPRDRNGSFEPVTVPQGSAAPGGTVDQRDLALRQRHDHRRYPVLPVRDLWHRDLARHDLEDHRPILDDLIGWQNRPLDRIYPVLLIDAIVVKIRDGQVANRPVYVVMGVNLDGERDVLGLWVGPTGGEGAKFWLTVLTELRNRGIADCLIVCCDGLKGLPEAIRATWPQADVQTCVVHLVRSSLRYTSKKHWGQVCRELREIYTAPTAEAAEARFAEFADTWAQRYPAMIETWRRAWGEFVPFLDFPVELRRIVYTTNAVESLNARFRKAVRHRTHFPNEQAALKVRYLVATEKRPNRSNPTGKVNGWKSILNALTIHYGERIAATN